jgi:hypothetical protein
MLARLTKKCAAPFFLSLHLKFAVPTGVPRQEESEEYHSDFVRTHCVDFLNGRGHVFKSNDQTIERYPNTASADWIPPQQLSKLHTFSEMTLMTGEWLDELYADVAGMDNLLPEQVEFIIKTSTGIRKLHALMMEHVKKQIESAIGVERLKL